VSLTLALFGQTKRKYQIESFFKKPWSNWDKKNERRIWHFL